MAEVNVTHLPTITFVIRDVVGGVAYMNYQIIRHAALHTYFTVRIVLLRQQEDKEPPFKEKFDGATTEYFSYSSFGNNYSTLKRLHKVIHQFPGIIVTNDGLELECIKMFGSTSLVYAIVHDFYNLRVALAYYNQLNVLLCHTESFARTLRSSPYKQPRIDYLPHGVVVSSAHPTRNEKNKLRIAYIGRMVRSKGVQNLFDIEKTLIERNILVEWIIIGSGELESEVKQQWEKSDNVFFHKPASNDEILTLVADCDIFLSLSTFEGYGIALLEAMSKGLVPIVYDLPVGITSFISSEIGFCISLGDVEAFASKIELLNADRDLLYKMKMEAQKLVKEQFNIKKTAAGYRQSFLNTKGLTLRERDRVKTLGLFDKWYIPERLTRLIKRFKRKAI